MRGRPAGQTKLAQPAGGGGGWLRAAPCLAQKAAQTGPQADRGGGGCALPAGCSFSPLLEQVSQTGSGEGKRGGSWQEVHSGHLSAQAVPA